ncbi:hypothetical protein ASPVEDRAFT_89584 [Aspergillus versicolor CBS 583.65]|uniref:F-box domain-containing protein n=1 Tax=Aspergillus versicolor CBS 583.65 TaxID=1036611 RepID=A0A1L9Q3R3_ASPVE|nr:uncharacterized protein ASPVEDRAFT_89584 [Aspergillus versicolor CBS 583.65]OJJ08359.1 hypothetical protein ASPVEDRAFT_89584 [Aspergillus versicolor CBS 583.65]
MNQTTDTDYNEAYIQVTTSVAGQLPIEILRLVLYQLVECDPPTDPNFFGNVPHQLCVVNRHWNRAYTPFLYAHYRLHSKETQIKGLWGFLRTLYNNPEIAKHVRFLVLTDENPNLVAPHIYDDVYEELTTLSEENLS